MSIQLDLYGSVGGGFGAGDTHAFPELEYRAGVDADEEFIPKTVMGFAGGTVLMGLCLNLAWTLFLMLSGRPLPAVGQVNNFWSLMAFTVGIAGVASSLLLVGLKVRADHSPVQLFARHWLNSISTGAAFAMLVWGPWVLAEGGSINRFVASGVWMVIVALPAVAARWVVAPEKP
jgi:hypothetical protein